MHAENIKILITALKYNKQILLQVILREEEKYATYVSEL